MKAVNYLFTFLLMVGFSFGCQTENKQDTFTEEQTEVENKFMPEQASNLDEYEYICNHCQLGSHEAGTCPCGMEYTQNANFKGATIDEDAQHHGEQKKHDDHDGHDH